MDSYPQKIEHNSKETVSVIFDKLLDKQLVNIFQSNKKFYNKINTNQEFKKTLEYDSVDLLYEEGRTGLI